MQTYFMKDYVLIDSVFVDANSTEKFGYSDGDETEDYILSTITSASDLSVGSEELVTAIKDWPTLYHLHPKRVNVLRPMAEVLKGKRVLEIGSGCGAITRYLGETADDVTAVEGSFRRAQITAARCRDLDNVKVVCDNFMQYDTAERFEVITLIGVLEYANIYVKGDDPAGSMLNRVRSLLAPGGTLLIAIENKLGLKYWAGAPEDHTGQAYLGIENLYSSSTAVTYGKKELQELLGKNGFPETAFLYPFPDYKLPDSVVTEEGLQTADFSVPMLLLENFEYVQSEYYSNHFSTSLVAAELDKNGLLAEFSNSFLIAASTDGVSGIVNADLLAVRYNSQRKREYQKVNVFRKKKGEIVVEKSRLYARAQIQEGAVKNTLDHEPYFKGRLLLFDLIKIVSQKQWSTDSIVQWSQGYFTILKDLSTERGGILVLDGKYFDLTPFNIILGEQDSVRIFDQEWTYPGYLPLGYIFFRGINYALGAISFFNIPADGTPEDILLLTCDIYKQFLPLAGDTVELYRELEMKNISGIGIGSYIPFLPVTLKFRKEALMERQVIQLDHTVDHMKLRIEQLQTNLAHANHNNFLQEAELEAVRHMADHRRPSFPEIERIASEVTRLSDLIVTLQLRPASPVAPAGETDEEVVSLSRQITELEKNIQWYKKTYEDRSFLGVIKQKIALKLAK
jgi:SAM-dependent methyltransferase